MSVASSRGSPWRQRRGLLDEPARELVGDRLLDQEPGAGQADLPGVVVLLDREVDGQVQVGVGEDQQRRLAAELEAEPA